MRNFIIYAAAVILVSCNTPEGEKATITEKQEVSETTGIPYTLDTNSVVRWSGSKPTGTHTGTFKIKEGSFVVNGNQLAGGSFTIDIASITDEDLAPGDGKEKLEGHLKSADFFDADKYPTALFQITSVEPYSADSADKSNDATHLIKGNFTLKDSTKNISFPAKISMDSTTLKAVADFNIDRTMWGMNYKGPNNPQDWVISKQVNIKLNILGSKK